jgi:hypothetical protein
VKEDVLETENSEEESKPSLPILVMLNVQYPHGVGCGIWFEVVDGQLRAMVLTQ